MKKDEEIGDLLREWRGIVLVFLVLVGAFYWFELRPANIHRQCEVYVHNFGVLDPTASVSEYNFQYSGCLHKYGL